MSNIFQSRRAFLARSKSSAPVPSRMRLRSTVYPFGGVVRVRPTPLYGNSASCWEEMKAWMDSRLGLVQKNMRMLIVGADDLMFQGWRWLLVRYMLGGWQLGRRDH